MKKKKKKTFSLSSNRHPIFEDEFHIDGESVVKEFECCYHRNIAGDTQGILYVTQYHLCFLVYDSFSFMKGSHKIIVDTESIEEIQLKSKSIIITKKSKSKIQTLEFTSFKNITETYDFLNGIWHQKIDKFFTDDNHSIPSKKESIIDTSSYLRISNEDLEQLERSADTFTFGAGDVILDPTREQERCIYFIKQGKVKLQTLNQKDILLSTGSAFGFEGFLLNSLENDFKVISFEENTKVCRFEGYYIDTLQIYDPRLSAWFYFYLADSILQYTLRGIAVQSE